MLQISDVATAFLCRMKKIGSMPIIKGILESDHILKLAQIEKRYYETRRGLQLQFDFEGGH